MLKWKDEYSIGVELLDAQHKHLFEIGNEAFELLTDEMRVDKYDRIVQVLKDLKQYTIYHFKCEEDFMQSISYKKLFSQKVDHDEFIKKINGVNLEHIDEDQNEYLKELLAFIFDWILDHILTKDMLIKDTLVKDLK
jgi:hemerythrin